MCEKVGAIVCVSAVELMDDCVCTNVCVCAARVYVRMCDRVCLCSVCVCACFLGSLASFHPTILLPPPLLSFFSLPSLRHLAPLPRPHYSGWVRESVVDVPLIRQPHRPYSSSKPPSPTLAPAVATGLGCIMLVTVAQPELSQ